MDIPPYIQTALTALIGLVVGSLYKHALDYFKSGKEWREKTGEKIDKWITPEERASWCDMHDKYSALGFNGLIDTYRQKLNNLPDKQI